MNKNGISKKSKLSLSRQTLRALTEIKLGGVVGGAKPDDSAPPCGANHHVVARVLA